MVIAPPAHTRNEGTTDSWITPPELIERLGPFDLDPCECIPQPWSCAERSYTEEDNGLMQPWDGLVWCNPPYGKQARRVAQQDGPAQQRDRPGVRADGDADVLCKRLAARGSVAVPERSLDVLSARWL